VKTATVSTPGGASANKRAASCDVHAPRALAEHRAQGPGAQPGGILNVNDPRKPADLPPRHDAPSPPSPTLWYPANSATSGNAGRRIAIKTLRRVIFFVIIVLGLYLLLPKLVGTEKSLKLIAHATWPLLVIAVVLEICALTGYANLFRYLLHILAIRLQLRKVMAITLSAWP